jgi:predicted alpha/beta superfamily hydrolase
MKLVEKFTDCKYCGKHFKKIRSSREFCSNLCRSSYRRSNNRPGKWMENGYIVIYSGDGNGIKEHVFKMEKKIKRKLKRNEVVHHINGIRDDNRMCNLLLMTNGEHSRLHRQQEIAANKKLF